MNKETNNFLIKRIIKKNGVVIYMPVTLLRKVVGYGLVGYGLGSSFILFSGSGFALMGGCVLLGKDYKKFIKTINFYSVAGFNWVYQHRNKKLRVYHRHLRGIR